MSASSSRFTAAAISNVINWSRSTEYRAASASNIAKWNSSISKTIFTIRLPPSRRQEPEHLPRTAWHFPRDKKVLFQEGPNDTRRFRPLAAPSTICAAQGRSAKTSYDRLRRLVRVRSQFTTRVNFASQPLALGFFSARYLRHLFCNTNSRARQPFVAASGFQRTCRTSV